MENKITQFLTSHGFKKKPVRGNQFRFIKKVPTGKFTVRIQSDEYGNPTEIFYVTFEHNTLRRTFELYGKVYDDGNLWGGLIGKGFVELAEWLNSIDVIDMKGFQ